jgi:hypothetical protein
MGLALKVYSLIELDRQCNRQRLIDSNKDLNDSEHPH